MKFDLIFTTDYRQFYINDIKANGNTSSENFWSDEAFEDKLAIEDGVIGVGISNDEGNVICQFEILESKNTITNFDEFDHVVEGSIRFHSGILQVMDCPNSEIELESKIENGDYRLRVYSSNLKSVYDEIPNDFYNVEIWKEDYSDRKVLKRYIE